MNYVKIVNGVVETVAYFDKPMPQGWGNPGDVWVQDDTAQIGWTYANGVFTAPPPPPPPPPQPVTQVTSAQAKIALHRAGLLDQVKTAVAADAELQLWYDNATTWERANTHITQLGTQLGLTSAQIDALFTQASQIQ